MYLTASLIALAGLLFQAAAAPNGVEERGMLTAPLHFTLTLDTVMFKVTSLTTTTVTTTVSPAANGKRDLSATTFPASRLSSACSCILTAKPSPTTVVTTVVATVTVKTSPTACSVPTPIVKNGDFEIGSLAPWALTEVIPPLPEYSEYLTLGVSNPGYGGSEYAFQANDEAASSYVEIDIAQSLTLCTGAKYNFAAKFYITDARDGPQTFVEAFIDNTLVAINDASDAVGPPIVWKTLTGSFTAGSATPTLTIKFAATDYMSVQWGVDNVVITPA
ncbi:MAG: hypothetical protein L6R39_002588 [Caloplaca ligustica]|nr:MAG: hypothetical protein L6R39_002588 [Caloplaca ligustica]